VHRRRRRSSKPDPFKAPTEELLAEYPRLSRVRVREIQGAEGYTGEMSILREAFRMPSASSGRPMRG
jgi:hypothetical protein